MTDGQDMCNGFNQYFSTVGENTVHDLLKNSTNPSCNLSDFKNYCHMPVKNSMFVTPTDSNETETVIRKLVNSKSPGYANIGPKLTKYIAPAIMSPLVHIFNLSLLNGTVPGKLKIGKVCLYLRKEIVL